VKVRGNAYYAGSTERFTFYEAKDQKVFLEVELGDGLKVTQHPVEGIRPMLDLSLDCAGSDIGEVMSGIEKVRDPDAIKGALVRLTLLNISESAYRALNLNHIRKLFAEAMLFKPDPLVVGASGVVGGQSLAIRPLVSEWEEFIKQQDVPKEKRRISEMGRAYLEKGSTDEGPDA
jgi:hypothetical protein